MTLRAARSLRPLVAVGVIVLLSMFAMHRAGAIETREFALDPGDGGTGGVEIEVDGRGRGTGTIRLTNKLSEPLTLTLDAVPATASSGRVRLGGDAEPPTWLELPPEVVLAPGEGRTVTIDVRGAELGRSPSSATAAVVARPSTTVAASQAAAVVTQAALVVYLRSVASPETVSDLGVAPWLGVLALLAVGAAAVRAFGKRHGRRQSVSA